MCNTTFTVTKGCEVLVYQLLHTCILYGQEKHGHFKISRKIGANDT